jgi:hypothetical protein
VSRRPEVQLRLCGTVCRRNSQSRRVGAAASSRIDTQSRNPQLLLLRPFQHPAQHVHLPLGHDLLIRATRRSVTRQTRLPGLQELRPPPVNRRHRRLVPACCLGNRHLTRDHLRRDPDLLFHRELRKPTHQISPNYPTGHSCALHEHARWLSARPELTSTSTMTTRRTPCPAPAVA